MLWAALVGLVALGFCSAYSWWLIYRANVAVLRLASCQASPELRADRRDGYVLRILPHRWRGTWRRFRTTTVGFNAASAEPVPAAAFDELRHLPFLETVEFGNRPFNPHDLHRLSAARQIRNLHFYGHGRRISDDALDAILRLRRLQLLTLTSSCLSDEGVARLAALKRLTQLDLRYCHCVSQDAVTRLAEKLPDCNILYEPPVAYHRYTCPACGYAINLSERNGPMGRCWKCNAPGPTLVQRNFDICHPVIEHCVSVRSLAK